MRWRFGFGPKKAAVPAASARSEASSAGLIRHYGLTDWWLSAFTTRERERIESVYASSAAGRGPHVLTEGPLPEVRLPVVEFLFDLADRFPLPEDQGIGATIRKKGADLARRHPKHQAGYYLGRHFSTYQPDIEHLQRAGHLDDAERLLVALLNAMEAEAEAAGTAVVPWYYEQLAAVYRNRKDPVLAQHVMTRLHARLAPAPPSPAAEAPAAPPVGDFRFAPGTPPPAGAKAPEGATTPPGGTTEPAVPVPAAVTAPPGAKARDAAPLSGSSVAARRRKPTVAARTLQQQRPAAAAPAVLLQLSLDRIVSTENQPRKTFHQESLEELAASIAERGVLEPIVVRPVADGKYEIVMGERRFRAAEMAGLERIPTIVREMSSDDAQADALVENFQREDLNPIERARAIQGLLRFMSGAQVGKTLGVSPSTLRRSLDLLELPQDVQAELAGKPDDGAAAGSFNEGHARALIALNDDPATQSRLVGKIKQEKLNIPDLEKVIAAIKQFPDKKEAFLQVPIGVTEQMLRHFGATGKERRKAVPATPKPRTPEQHLKAIAKAAQTLSDLLDENLVPLLNTPQKNQLLATTGALSRETEALHRAVRQALQTDEHDFREIYVACPLCGRTELIGAERCSVCASILRRCYDCAHYDRPFERCGVDLDPVYVNEAVQPREDSKSFRCPRYEPRFPSRGVKLAMVS
jgi:ParB family chromosome partitioning protein